MLSINNKDLTQELLNKSKQEYLNSFISICLQKQLPFALYRLPDTNEIIGITDLHQNRNNHSNGFIISPFIINEKTPYFINADLCFRIVKDTIHIEPEILANNPELISFLEAIHNNTQEIQLPVGEINQKASENNYISIAKKAIENLKEGKFKKVVLARTKRVSVNPNINLLDLFLTLEERQAGSFVSLFYLPGQSIWIGSSPEVLISKTKDGILRTMALAATQRALSDDLCKAVWTQKEIEEQALVARYIINCFKSIRLREFEEDGPKTVRSGNLLHLKTDFSVNTHTHKVEFPNLENQLLNLLHPTSAVCGMPKEEALNFINENEGIDRKFYSGYIGPVNMDQESHIFVNIRCAEFNRNTAILYSGAGITAESNPEKELEETELKMQLLENLLSNK